MDGWMEGGREGGWERAHERGKALRNISLVHLQAALLFERMERSKETCLCLGVSGKTTSRLPWAEA